LSSDFEKVWVSSTSKRRVHAYDRKDNNELLETDIVNTPEILTDNIAISGDDVYVTGIQQALKFINHVESDKNLSPFTVLRFNIRS
jgi:hypothetical protein